MEHGDPLRWWRLDPEAKAAAVAYLCAKGLDRQDEERRKAKSNKRPHWAAGVRLA